jgi:transcriptional regulator with XRE-family HTH domain
LADLEYAILTNAGSGIRYNRRVTGSRARGRRPNGDQSDLAQQIGTRLRAARLAAGLTQQQLASPLYTKAYVSALENGLSRPSMTALTFLADRLGLPAERFIGNAPAVWSRLDADLALAAHRWQEAADGYRALLHSATARAQRAELLLGLAEALAGIGQAMESGVAAEEAGRAFRMLGRDGEAALARYWVAVSLRQQGNFSEARSLLDELLGLVRGGLRVEPDFELRLVMAQATVSARAGEHDGAVGLLDQIQRMAAGLDDHRRATYYHELACTYRNDGNFDAAIAAGTASLTLYRSAASDFEIAELENELALSNLALGHAERAADLADDARSRFERLGEDRWLAHVLDTQARIALARNEQADGVRLANEALGLAERTSNAAAEIDALVTLARAEVAGGDREAAFTLYERAAASTRAAGSPARLREVLAEWAELLAKAGEHQRAFEVMREAVKDAG